MAGRTLRGKSAQIMRDVEVYLRKTRERAPRSATSGQPRASAPSRSGSHWVADDDGTLYWPGGRGGGGRRKGGSRLSAVVRPHARTSPSCKRCGQFHTTAEHARHSGGRGRPASPKKKKKKAGPASRPASSKSRGKAGRSKRRMTDDQLLDLVIKTVAAVPAKDRYDLSDVFVSEVYRRIGKRIGMTLSEFKAWLVEQNHARRLALVRLDLVDMAPRRVVDASEINHLGASFHQILDRSRR